SRSRGRRPPSRPRPSPRTGEARARGGTGGASARPLALSRRLPRARRRRHARAQASSPSMTSEARRRLLAPLAAAPRAPGPRLRADEGTDERGAVQGLIADAVAEYDAGHFEEARALFRRAQAEAPSARTLRGIGMASFELRDYVEADRALAAALGE